MLTEWCVNNSVQHAFSAPLSDTPAPWVAGLQNIQVAWVTSVSASPLICTDAAKRWTSFIHRASVHEIVHPCILLCHWLRHILGEAGLSALGWVMCHSWWMSQKHCTSFPIQKVNMETWTQTILSPNDHYLSAFLQATSTQLLQWAVTVNFKAWEHSDSVI